MNLTALNLSLALAPPPTPPGTQPDPRGQFLGPAGMLVIMVVMMYFVLWRPQQKKAKAHAALLKAVRPGDKILTTGPPLIYMYTHRPGAIREIILDEFLMLYPGNTDAERVRGLREEMVKNRPKIVILDPFLEDRRRRHTDALLVPFLRDFGYQKVGDYYYLRPN